MIIFVLTYKIGLSSGFEEFIGLYTSKEKAEIGKSKDMKIINFGRNSQHYHIEEVRLDKELNIKYLEW